LSAAVQVRVETLDGTSDPLCPPCIAHLGRRNPETFPTIEEYEEAKRRYPEPVFDYEAPDEIWDPAYDASWISRETLTR
jgi:hypothetical protein